MIRSLHINRVIVDRSVPRRAINPKVGNVSCETNAPVSHRDRSFLEKTTVSQIHFTNITLVIAEASTIVTAILKFRDYIGNM